MSILAGIKIINMRGRGNSSVSNPYSGSRSISFSHLGLSLWPPRNSSYVT